MQRWHLLQAWTDTLARVDGTEATITAILAEVLPTSGAAWAALALLTADGREFTLRRVSEGASAASTGDGVEKAPRVVGADPTLLGDELREPLFLAATWPPQPGSATSLWPGVLGSPAAAAILPLRAGARLLGVLGLGFDAPQRFDEAERAFLLLIAHACAQALEQAHRGEREQAAVQALAAAQQRFKEADRRKDEFLAMLGHELRNPLMPIRNTLVILQRPGPPRDPELHERAYRIIDRQVRHMVRLVDDLLDVSRIESGKIELRRQRIDVIETVRQAVESCQELVRAQQHELVLDLPEGPLEIEADPTRLEQVLCNLLNNAAKYTEPRGHIEVRVRREGEEVVLRVRDNGIGLSPESRERIFDLFMQADRALVRSEGGLGLGLTLVRQLVEMHGGTVAAASEGPGRGSEFTVRLPVGQITAALPAASVGVAPTESLGSSGKHVLLIEDSEDIRTTMALLLELEGHRVSLAVDGQEGLERLLAQCPDVALVDVGLPRLDGYELARRARQALGQRVVLIAVTGYGQAEDRQRALAAGFDLHLTKPVNLDELLRLLSANLPAHGAGPGQDGPETA
jgi:signal transduction histidine kinase/ActR/RegA family two-component response regulator